jgi:hypothetical protein
VNTWIVLGVLVLLAVCGLAAVLSLWTSVSRAEHQEVADLAPMIGKEARTRADRVGRPRARLTRWVVASMRRLHPRLR